MLTQLFYVILEKQLTALLRLNLRFSFLMPAPAWIVLTKPPLNLTRRFQALPNGRNHTIVSDTFFSSTTLVATETLAVGKEIAAMGNSRAYLVLSLIV